MTLKNQLLVTVMGSAAAAIALGIYVSAPAAQANNANSDATLQNPQNQVSTDNTRPSEIQAKSSKTDAPKKDAKITKINWQPDFASAQRVAKADDKPVMIIFGASWCGACKMLKQNTLTNQRVVEAAQDWVAVEIDTDKEPKLAAQYGITSLPTTVFFKGDSKKLGFVGAAGPEDMLNVMRTAHAKLQGAPAAQS